MTGALTSLDHLEAESIEIIREAVAARERPVMLYSIGKDSSVMLHLAQKAFHPGAAAVSAAARRHHLEIPRDVRPPRAHGRAKPACGSSSTPTPRAWPRASLPFTHGSSYYTDVMKTEALKQALDAIASTSSSAGRAATKRSRGPRSGSSRSARAGHRWDPEGAAARAVEPLQHPHPPGREHPRLPALELDRAGHLALHRARAHPDRAAVLRRGAPGGRAQRHADHGR